MSQGRNTPREIRVGGLSLSDMGIPVGPEHDCSYLSGRRACERAFRIKSFPSVLYQSLMDYGWRRSGQIVYKPVCQDCRACRPIRVPTAYFKPNRTQSKLMKRDWGLKVIEQPPRPTEEKFELFCRYQAGRHSGNMCTDWEEFSRFLYSSPVPTREFCFFEGESLKISAIVDFDERFLSSVYTYFDPVDAKRSYGIWTILWLIEYCRQNSIPYYYLGYYIEECRKMNYKDKFRPCEVGDGEGKWERRV